MKSTPPPKPKKLTFTLNKHSYSLLENLSNDLHKSPKEVAKEALEAYVAYLVEKKKHPFHSLKEGSRNTCTPNPEKKD